MSYLGLDIGTSACKAAAFDECGKQISHASREYPIHSARETWAELDSAKVMECCFDIIRQVSAECRDDPIRAIGISSQGEAFTAVDSEGNILANAMVSSDSRAAKISVEWTEQFGAKTLYEITGHTASPMFTLFKLIWLRDNEPDIWSRAAGFYCFEDLLNFKLGIPPSISWCLAGRTAMFNVRTHKWDERILDTIGLDVSKLASPIQSGEMTGTIPKKIAQKLGLPEGVIVAAGGHDQCCGALGAGIVSSHKAVYGMGTVDCITPAFAEPIFSDDLFTNNLATYDYTANNLYTTVAYSLTGGNILKWFRDQFGQLETTEAEKSGVSEYELLLAEMKEEPSGLMVLPYWTPSGTPFFDSETKGAIIGLRMATRREDLMRGLLEGVAFEMKLNLNILARSGIAVNELTAIGGGANSRKLVQLKADVLNCCISRTRVTEAGCLGAAMLAKRATSGEDVVEIASEWIETYDTIEPIAANAAFYDEMFESYIDLYQTIKSFTARRKRRDTA